MGRHLQMKDAGLRLRPQAEGFNQRATAPPLLAWPHVPSAEAMKQCHNDAMPALRVG